jgi:hypothetical protein
VWLTLMGRNDVVGKILLYFHNFFVENIYRSPQAGLAKN